MQDELVTSGDAEKLSAGVAKDAINKYNAKKNLTLPLYYLYPNVSNLTMCTKELVSVVLKWCSGWMKLHGLTMGRERSK